MNWDWSLAETTSVNITHHFRSPGLIFTDDVTHSRWCWWYVRPSGQSCKGDVTSDTQQSAGLWTSLATLHPLPVLPVYTGYLKAKFHILSCWLNLSKQFQTDCHPSSPHRTQTQILIWYCFAQCLCMSTRCQNIEFSQFGEIQTCQPGDKHLSTHVSPSTARPPPGLNDSPAFVYLQWMLTLIICSVCERSGWAEKDKDRSY